MMRHLMFFVLVCLACWSMSSASVCSYASSKSKSRKTTEDCGWWGWSSCTLVVYFTAYELRHKCCPDSYGTVASGCNGECPYSTSSQSALCSTEPGYCRDYMCDKSGFESAPTSVKINENNNAAVLLWSTDGTSFVQYQQDGERTSKNVPSTDCSVVSTNGIAEVRDGTHIYRKACTNPTCTTCGSSDVGCLDSSVAYYVKVSCYAPGYTNTGKIEHTFSIDVEKAETVQFVLSEDEYDEEIAVNSDMSIGDVVLTIDNIVTPSDESGVTFFLQSPESNITGEPFFKWDGDNQQIVVASDLSQESSGTHTVLLCASQRRGLTCIGFEVTFERITTTTSTTSTTSTTPSTTTTPEVKHKYICQAFGIWKRVPGFDMWCDIMCKDNAVNCPYLTHCVCVDVEDERINCTSVGYWAGEDMDAWCYHNCNYGDYSHCPSRIDNENAYCDCG